MTKALTVEERLQVLEDVEDIRRLKALYARYWDAGFKSDDLDPAAGAARLAELFTEDAAWDSDYAERVLRSHIEDDKGGSRQFTGISLHMLGNETIDVTGDTAIGRWNGLIAGSVAGREQAYWMGVHYESRFRRTEDGWKYSSQRADIGFTTSFEGPGWVKDKLTESNK